MRSNDDSPGKTNGKILIPKRVGITGQLVQKSFEITNFILECVILDNCQNEDALKERISNHSNDSDSTTMKYSSGTLSHNFALKSVYSHEYNGSVEGTTFQDEWLTVDYIFYRFE